MSSTEHCLLHSAITPAKIQFFYSKYLNPSAVRSTETVIKKGRRWFPSSTKCQHKPDLQA